MEKIKVSKEIKEDLDIILNTNFNRKEDLINYHKKNGWKTRKSLNSLSFDEFVMAIYVGYELEKNEDELLKESYYTHVRPEHKEFDRGFRLGTLNALDCLNIKIKGINA